MVKIDVFIYIYYEFSIDFLNHLLPLEKFNTRFIFCLSNNLSDTFKKLIEQHLSNSIIIETPNIGKDIGGKLALMELYLNLKLKSDYLIFLHDKKSPHLPDGDVWSKELLKIIHKDNIAMILDLLEQNSSIGLVGAQKYLSNEYDVTTNRFETTNNDLLKKYILELKLTITDFTFLAGTMFWVRTKIFENFFRQHAPLDLRSRLEPGNVMDNEQGTHTHCLERILSWVVTQQNYKLKGI